MVRLPPEVKAWLAETAAKNDRSMNWVLVSILKEAMQEAAKNAAQ